MYVLLLLTHIVQLNKTRTHLKSSLNNVCQHLYVETIQQTQQKLFENFDSSYTLKFNKYNMSHFHVNELYLLPYILITNHYALISFLDNSF